MLTRIKCAEHLSCLLVRVDFHDGETVEDDEFTLSVREFTEGEWEKRGVSIASRGDTPVSALDGLKVIFSPERFGGERHLLFADGEASCRRFPSGGSYWVSVEDEVTGERLVAPGWPTVAHS